MRRRSKEAEEEGRIGTHIFVDSGTSCHVEQKRLAISTADPPGNGCGGEVRANNKNNNNDDGGCNKGSVVVMGRIKTEGDNHPDRCFPSLFAASF